MIHNASLETCPRIDPAQMTALGRLVVAGKAARATLLDAGLDLDPTDCRELADAIRKGSEAREALILANLALAIHFADRFAKYFDAELDEMVSHALIGLIRGADDYDPVRFPAVLFGTYAAWKIRAACRNSLGRKIDVQSIVDRRCVCWKHRQDDEPSLELLELECPGPEFDPDPPGEEARLCVDRLMARLDARSADIVARRFGLRGYSEHTYEAIGRVCGISRERVRQVLGRAINRLRRDPDKLDGGIDGVRKRAEAS